MALTPVTPTRIGNAPVALTTCTGIDLAPTSTVNVPTVKGDALTFEQARVMNFVVLNTTGSPVTLTALAGKTAQQNAAGVSVDDKTYAIEGNCMCIIETYEAASVNGEVRLYASGTGLKLFVFN